MNRLIAALALSILLVAGVATQAAEPPSGWFEPPRPKSPWQRLVDRVDSCSCGYGKTHHDFGCIGTRGECRFIFGSCWEFFEEPCYRQRRPRW